MYLNMPQSFVATWASEQAVNLFILEQQMLQTQFRSAYLADLNKSVGTKGMGMATQYSPPKISQYPGVKD